jgi:hypothetical protein
MPRKRGNAATPLPEDVKCFIITALASFDTPSQVAAAVKEEFGVEVSRQAVEGHDPNKHAGRNLSAKWRELFETTRKAFIEDTSQIAIAHRSTRLRALQRMAAKAEGKGNFPLAAALNKQAAEEMGNAYTNRREVTGKDGKDLPAAVSPAVAIFALPDNGRDG